MLTKIVLYWKWIVLGWALVATIILVRQCRVPTSVTSAKGDTIYVRSVAQHAKDSMEISKYLEQSAYWRNKYDSLYNRYTQKEKEIVVSAGKIRALSDSVHYFKGKSDTLDALVQCEALIQEDSILLELLAQAKIDLDSMYTSTIQERQVHDSTIIALRSDISQLSFAMSDLHHEYDQAILNENKALRKAKLNNIWAKVGTVTVAILTATLLLKK